MSASRWSFVLPALAVALSASPLWAQTMHYPFSFPAQTKPLSSGAQGIGSIGGGGGGGPSIGSGNISAPCCACPQPVCCTPASSAPKTTYKMYNLGDMGLLGENKSLAQDIAQNLPFLFPGTGCCGWQAVLLDKVLVVRQTPEVIAQVDEFLKKLQETLSVGKDRPTDKGQGRAVPREDKASSKETSQSGTSPWWNISGKRQKLNPEEEKLQRYWDDYYDSMGRYYQRLEHVENHGYQINTGAPGVAAPPSALALPSFAPSGPATYYGTQRDSPGEAVFKIYKLSNLGLTNDDGKLVQWIVDILPRIDVENKVGPLYLPEKGLLVVFYTPDVIAEVDSFLKKAKEAFAATKDSDVSTNPQAPTGPIVQVHCFWNKQVYQGSGQLAGITGRVYLFGPDLKYPYAAEAGSKIVAEMSWVHPDGKAQKSRFEFGKQNLDALLTRDVLGWGYAIPLPWEVYQEGIKEVTIQVSLIPECGDTIVGSPSTFVPKRPLPPVNSAPVPIEQFVPAPTPPATEQQEADTVFKVYKLRELGLFREDLNETDAAELGHWIANSLETGIPMANWSVTPVCLPRNGVLIVKNTPSVIAQVDEFLKSLKFALSPSEAPPSRPNANAPVSLRRSAPHPDAASPSPSIPGNPSADELQPAPPFPQESKTNPWYADFLAEALAHKYGGALSVKPSAAAPEHIVLIRSRSGDAFSGSKAYRNGEWVSEFPTGIMLLVKDAATQKVIVDIEADRMVSWSEGDADPLAQNNTANKKRLFYLAGRVEIRQPHFGDETRSIWANEAYYDLNGDVAVAIPCGKTNEQE